MKTIIFLFLACFSFSTFAVGPPEKQKVYSYIKQRQTEGWYEKQLQLWKAETVTNAKNADAWLNVYTATRMLKIAYGKRSQTDLDAVVESAEKNIPGTFEANYIQCWNGKGEKRYEYLFKAFEINPNRPEMFDDFVTYYELKRDKVRLKEFCEKWFASNDISEGLLAWNYNMLMSCEENSILITQGDNDTYPALILQQAKDVRKDVAVMNISLLLDKSYRDTYFKELSIPEFNGLSENKSMKENTQALCAHMQKYSPRSFYYANTVDPGYYENVKADVYSVGLAFKYSREGFDNVAVLRKNYEKNFLKDYLKIDLNNDISSEVINDMNENYLLPFITLYNHYTESEEMADLKELSLLVNNIAGKSGKTDEVQKILAPGTDNIISYVITDPRDLYAGMVKINEQLHASQFETGNDMYSKFLEDLLKQKRYDDLMIAKQEKVDWAALLLPVYKDLKPEQYFMHGRPEDAKFPVCNISYEAAVMYCDWLTNIYNNLAHKKKQFKKVKFRLPTEKEWEIMARSGLENKNKYPWGYLPDTESGFKRDNITNENGCYLANVQTGIKATVDPKVCPAHDGGVFPVDVNSYHPNDYGLYCIIGNVAEMVQEKGIAKGGGWQTPVDEAIISGQQKYTGSNPNTGFRVVMEVIEK
jgi:hypothetical protein